MSARKTETTYEDILYSRLSRIHTLFEQKKITDASASLLRGAAYLDYHVKRAKQELEKGDKEAMASSYLEATLLFSSITELEQNLGNILLIVNPNTNKNFSVSNICENSLERFIDYFSNFGGRAS